MKALREASVRWALSMLLCAVWLLLNAVLDGPTETDAFKAVELDKLDAINDARLAQKE